MNKRRYTLAATALGSSLAFIDASAVIVALPTIQKAMRLGLVGEQWVFLAYTLALAALYLIGGAIGDSVGRRKVFIWGAAGFALASALAGLSPNGQILITARVLQGVTGAFVTTNSLAWLRSVYGEHAGKAVGLWTSLTSISTIIAPLLGGALTQWLSWRWIFYINLPLVAVTIYWATRAIEDKHRPKNKLPIDIPSSLLIAATFGFLTYYLVQGAKNGFSGLWVSLLLGIISGLAFIIVQFRVKNPLLPLNLFRIRNFSISNLETLFIYGALSGIMFYFTLYLQFLGLSPLASSLFLIPTSIALILLAGYFGSMSDRKGPRVLLSVGPALIGTGSLLFSLIETKHEIWLWGTLGVAIFSFGLSMMVAPITTTALKSLPANLSGVASGVNNSVARLGGLIVVALAGMLISLIFFGHTSDKTAIPLNLHQAGAELRHASFKGYQAGMYLISAIAFCSASIGWFGLKSSK